MNFIPLHVYSEYSFLNSGLTLEKYFSCAKKANMSVLGVSDLGVMFSFTTFSDYCQKLNIKPVLGMDVIVDDLLLSIFIKNEEGYLNLIQISNTLVNNNVDYQVILKHQNGLKFVMPVSCQNHANASLKLEKFQNDLKDFYIGLEIYQTSDINVLKEFINKTTTKCLAFPHIKYLKKGDAIVLDIVKAIKDNKTLNYTKMDGNNYLYSEEELSLLYKDFDLFDLKDFISDIDFNLFKKRGHILNYTNQGSAKELLYRHCIDGLEKKGVNNPTYLSRLNYELDIINKMGFNDYFLIVEDYVKYAKTHDILVGPGRGSAAGSLVSFALDITTPDPLKHNLTFERFLNPNRKTMPDIDIDFEDIKREQIITYLREKYSNKHIANIVTFQTIGAKQAIRDIGRVFQFSDFDIDYLSKTLGNISVSFKQAYRTNQVFKNLLDSEPHYLKIVQLAVKIEGLIRQSSIHAAGVILNSDDITNVLPTFHDEAKHLIAQYEMTYLENQGFLKMDILALRNLTIIKNICENININPNDIPINDTKAIEIIKNNFTAGIFQLESGGMKKAIDVIFPSSFDDVTALIALFRPGPMDNIPLYAKRKNNKENIEYLNDSMKRILESTNGIIVYQEQITQIAIDIAGLSPIEADDFRRSISKKDISKMEVLKNKFISGCLKNNYDSITAHKIYDTIEKFASYGFNKAHSVSYAYIVMEMAYLKAHYPLQFYATLLESESSFASNKINEYLKEIRAQNISLLVPDINESINKFKIYNNKLLFPLNAIRGLQSRVVDDIIRERANKKFDSFFDFVTRMYKYNINEKIINYLIDAGAFDKFYNRETLRASLENAMNQAKFNASFANENSLFGTDFSLHFDYVQKPDNSLTNLNKEYQVLGIMVSDSPLNYKKDILQKYKVVDIEGALSLDGPISLGVIVNNIKIIRTKKNEQMAFLSVTDTTSDLEITIFPQEYAKYANSLTINSIIVVSGSFDKRKDHAFIADKIIKLED